MSNGVRTIAALLILLATASGALAQRGVEATMGYSLRAPVIPEDTPLELEVLRVCADPNNLPHSNRAEEGFENRLAELVARELGVPLEYEWRPQRRGFVRETLNSGKCDLVMGFPTGYELVSTTRPYYRSTYVFLSRQEDHLGISSLDDPKLRQVKVGVHTIGDDYANTPGAHALGKRGINRNVVGFRIFGDYSEPNPPARLVEAVADGTVDIAIAWGPLAGYFGKRQAEPLEMAPVSPVFDPPNQPFVFSISMGVRYGNYPLRKRLNEIIKANLPEIELILDDYNIPRV